MHPILAQLGPIPIHTYGFLIAIGFLAAVSIFKRLALRANLDVDKVLDMVFWGLAIGFVGARILFIITRLSSFMADPVSMFKVWEGGLVFWGGPIFVVPFMIWYCRKHALPFWKVGDIIIPGLAIAHAFGRLGCLAAGCCYGKPTGTNFGVKLYSELVDRNLQGVNLHPTQLYESFSLFVLTAGLLYINKHKRFDGQASLVYFMAYPVIRSVIEIYRGDTIRGFVIDDWLSTSQFISALIFVFAGVVLHFRLRQVHATAAVASAGRG